MCIYINIWQHTSPAGTARMSKSRIFSSSSSVLTCSNNASKTLVIVPSDSPRDKCNPLKCGGRWSGGRVSNCVLKIGAGGGW